jgi:DNA mismatch repair ATPase MutS
VAAAPLLSLEPIRDRLDAVESSRSGLTDRAKLRDALKSSTIGT